MANNPSAEKRHRQSLVRRDRNRRYVSRMRTFVKNARQAISTDAEAAPEAVRQAASVIDRVAQKGIIPKNAASRKIGRLYAALHRSQSEG